MEIIANPKSMRLYNHVLVKTDSEVEDVVTQGTLTIHKDTSYDKYRSKRIHGEVAAIPFALSRARIHQTDHAHPPGRSYFPGENIGRHIRAYEHQIGRPLAVKELQKYKSRYSSSSCDPQYTYNNEQPMLACIGEEAWFHYLALSDQSYIGQDNEHNRYYKVPYESIFCFTSETGHTKMANGYVQVEPYWNEDYQEIEVDGRKIRGKLKGNLVVGLKDEPEFRTGVIIRKGLDFGIDDRKTIHERDIVLYAKGSEFKNRIKGNEVYLMQQWQIIARRDGNRFNPVGDYVQIRVKKKPPGVIISLEDIIEDKGEVLAIGENCQYVRPGGTYFFNPKATIFNLEDTILLKEGQILAEYGN